jgi:hypothetical protein
MANACQLLEQFQDVVGAIGWYFVPAAPLVSRGLLCLRWRRCMNDVLPEPAQERDLHRTTVLALAGFSFTAVVGLSVLDLGTRSNLQLSVWYGLVSCVCYLGAFNLQAYKVRRFQDQFGMALIEAGSLALALTLLSLLFSSKFDSSFQWAAVLLAIGFWLTDHVTRLVIDYRILKDTVKPKRIEEDERKEGDSNGKRKETSGKAARSEESSSQKGTCEESRS